MNDIESGNILYGKKWCACGDSFTSGDFTGMEEADYLIPDGIYAGKKRVYPYLIGARNQMEVVNLAVGGMTMCCVDGTRENAFTYREYYKNIPADADYITLKFGINDMHQNSPLGTIDDMNITTYYGAWNTVLSYITENHPFAKVGIIISNGMFGNFTYADAAVRAAVRWGIPYIDEVHDPKVPLLHRVKREGLTEEAYERRMKAFSVNEVNRHPNPAAHEFESTFIEAWLRTL